METAHDVNPKPSETVWPVTAVEAAEILGITPKTVRVLMTAGEIAHRSVGPVRLIDQQEVARVAAERADRT